MFAYCQVPCDYIYIYIYQCVNVVSVLLWRLSFLFDLYDGDINDRNDNSNDDENNSNRENNDAHVDNNDYNNDAA